MAKYLDDNGMLYLIQALKAKFDEKLNKSEQIEISTVIGAESTDLTAASSKAVKDYVKSALANISGITSEITETLPESGESNVIYLVPKSNADNGNAYEEYMWINNNWEHIGSTDIDLSEYVKLSDLQPLTNVEIETMLASVEE